MSNEAIKTIDNSGRNFFRASAADFKKIPGYPIAYWVSKQVGNAFQESKPISSYFPVKPRIRTGNDEWFLKMGKMITEMEDYEREMFYTLATKQVAIDLDDGVKVNYPKFGAALKKIPGLDKKEK